MINYELTKNENGEVTTIKLKFEDGCVLNLSDNIVSAKFSTKHPWNYSEIELDLISGISVKFITTDLELKDHIFTLTS